MRQPIENTAMAYIPPSAEALFFDGTQRLGAGDALGAETSLRAALALAPTLAEAHANLGLALEARGALAEAADCYRSSLAHNPTLPQTWVNLAGALLLLRQLEDAEMACAQALRLQPGNPGAWCNLGAVYARMGLELESEEACREAIYLEPGHAKARFNLAYLLLRQGRWAGSDGGWAQFESRDWYAALAQRLACPRWQGEPLAGRSVLVGCEAGHGDMLQFGRFCATLKARGAGHVSLLCHPPLMRLLATLPGVDALVAMGAPLPHTDTWTPLLSLPALCQTRVDTVPAPVPYLRAEAGLRAAWAPRLPASGLRVGLVWKGNPQFENDAERSLAHLHQLAPLAAVPGIGFIGLQKGAGEAETAPWLATSLGPQLHDFADTAAIVDQLDLLISVDTAVAHLAGALGTPCWLLLPDYLTDWRWLTARSDTPWYPGSMRLFRQPPGGGWAPVVAELAAALAQWAAAKS